MNMAADAAPPTCGSLVPLHPKVPNSQPLTHTSSHENNKV